MEIEAASSLVAGPSQGSCALPPNNGMELTVKSVTPFASAKAAPLFPAAHPRR